MSREQRWAASGVVVLLGALWGALGVAAIVESHRGQGDDMTGAWVFAVGLAILATSTAWLVAGLTTVGRVAAGGWPWRPVAALVCVAAILSGLGAGATWSTGDELVPALLAFQAVALVAYAALLWTPSPVAPPSQPPA